MGMSEDKLDDTIRVRDAIRVVERARNVRFRFHLIGQTEGYQMIQEILDEVRRVEMAEMAMEFHIDIGDE